MPTASAFAALARPQAGGPAPAPPARPRPAPRARGPLPRYLTTGGRRPRQPQRWPAVRAGARPSLVTRHIPASSAPARPPPPRTLRKAASPHLHRSSARVFPAFPDAPDPPGEVSPIPAPSDPHPRETGKGPGARAARGDRVRRRRFRYKVKQAPNAKGGRKNTAPRPLTEPRNPDSRRSALPNGRSALHAPQGCTQHPKVQTCRNIVNEPADPPSCSRLQRASRSKTQLGKDLCHSPRRCFCGDPPPAGTDSTRRRPARLLSTLSPPARLPPAARLRAASPSGGCQLPAAAG